MRISDRSAARRRVAAALALTLALAPSIAGSAEWKGADGGYAWEFPRDHWARRDYKIEWWYFTGHLAPREEPRQRFGYQFTIFRIGLLPQAIQLESDWNATALLMGHAAVTDLAAGEHRFSELLYREADFMAGFGEPGDPRIAWSRAPAGTDGEWTLTWNGEGFDFRMRDDRRDVAFELTTRPLKPRVFQGPNGYSRKSDTEGAASLYYSYTRLATTGTVTLDGRSWNVVGESWMDKEFSSSQLTGDQVGWDWFSLQLDDGRELMLYSLRDAAGDVDHARGTLVATDGSTRYLDADDWTARRSGSWRSPATGIVYPSGWRIELPAAGLELRVEPELADQENRSSLANGPSYWEGAVSVRDGDGRTIGRGYVELTGYGENNRPPI